MNILRKEICLFVFFTNFWLILCEENVTESIPKSIIVIRNDTNGMLKKIKHQPLNGTILSQNGTKTETKLRMVTVCTTPNGDSGYCMPLKNCTKMMNQLENVNARKFLLESKCGPKHENVANPSICCGKYANYKKSVKEENPFPKQCGKNVHMKSRIYGGKEAALGEFPWMARLIHKNKRSHIKTFGCGGSLITVKFVLTAAHCLKSENVENLGPIFEVQFGEHNTDTKIDCDSKNESCADKPQVVRLKKSIVHPHYDTSSINHYNDIALIHLKKAVKITDYVAPICVLHNFDFEPFEYWISGWGSTRTQRISPIKMKLSLPPYPHSNCTDKYKIVNVRLIDNQICAGGKKNKDSCAGDSGGPLMVVKNKNWFAAGVVSFGFSCGREGWPGIYTNVTSYLPWIQKTILKRTNSTL